MITHGRLVVVALLAITLGAPGASSQPASSPPAPTFVIVHGAWGGGWDWRGIDSLLTAQGHHVHRVTLTGLGERVHLASPTIGLATHVADVVNTIEWEQLTSVVLVGHSYGGMVISGAADQIPARIRALIYVDAFLPESGESVERLIGERFAAFVAQSREGMIPPSWVTPDLAIPKDVPHPLKTFTDTLVLSNPAARRLPASYILTLDPGAAEDMFSPYAARAAARGWPVHRLEADHTPERSAPTALVALLRQLP
jgi:pimeloyl-ACP methyl ester carboxylesterase